MARKRRHFYQDAVLVAISILVAIYIVKTGAIDAFAESLGELEWAGAFIAGMLFTSVFTTAPAIVILGELAVDQSIWSVAFIGAAGAVVGDFILFQLVRNRIKEDISFLLQQAKIRRFPRIFRTHLFHSITPLIGALIIASPLPDELGLALLGVSKVTDRSFIYISYAMNALGIVVIGLVASSMG